MMGRFCERGHPVSKLHAAYLTAELPGTGGMIKECAEDFLVEEVPAYLPSGQGEHCYALIEKRGIGTLEAIRRIAKVLGASERDIGYAGMKDAIGVTRQTISIPRVDPDRLLGLQIPGITVLSAHRHGNKLRLGHLKGNRFRIRIRGVVPGAASRAEAVLTLLEERGVPNFFGFQRYGAQGNSQLIGGAMVRGDYRAAVDALIGVPEAVEDPRWRQAIEAYRRDALEESLSLMPGPLRVEREVLSRLLQRPGQYDRVFHAVQPRLKRLYLSAFQSSLFDRVLESRLADLDRLREGDIAFKHENGACFAVRDLAAESARAAAFEISATGPMFGCTMMQPEGAQQELEQRLLAEQGVTLEDFNLSGGLKMEGERRALRVPLKEVALHGEGEDLLVEFALPRGSYATSVLREITK